MVHVYVKPGKDNKNKKVIIEDESVRLINNYKFYKGKLHNKLLDKGYKSNVISCSDRRHNT